MPLVQRKILEYKRFNLLRRLEKKRGSWVISLIHRQETMSFLGFPFMRFIDINDLEEVLGAIRMTPDTMPMDLILHTPGVLF